MRSLISKPLHNHYNEIQCSSVPLQPLQIMYKTEAKIALVFCIDEYQFVILADTNERERVK